MLKDVLDGLKMVSEGIKNVKDIAEAVRSGTNYLRAKHPDVRDDLKALVQELRKSLNVVKQASAILTNFRFAVAADARGLELARFNDYFIKSKGQAQDLRDHIEDLRTHCSKIREHAVKITGSATAPGFATLFGLLGLSSPAREAELGCKLDQLAYEDFQVANSADLMVTCLEEALKDIQNALGSGGMMRPDKIPDAAALLSQYGPPFEDMETEATTASREITELVKNLA